MDTHRCEGSIKGRISIRKCDPYEPIPHFNYGKYAWWILKHEHDWDTDGHSLQPVCQINYCPFCGVKL